MDTKYSMIIKRRRKMDKTNPGPLQPEPIWQDADYDLEPVSVEYDNPNGEITREVMGSRTALKMEESLSRVHRGEVRAFALVVLTEDEGLESITIKYDSPLSKMALEKALELAREKVGREIKLSCHEMSEVIED